ncbi:hypothetical protein CVT25_010436 [Psilocybe cyanescens]|uniref:Uncharacterized protein n=1 Tax=Psilocybe cyanescens TaxID=93625 RepID=A0A409XDM7_PSICY|nr:hypothetical protein CVT25_010436 [Psilocybe cyanescens]
MSDSLSSSSSLASFSSFSLLLLSSPASTPELIPGDDDLAAGNHSSSEPLLIELTSGSSMGSQINGNHGMLSGIAADQAPGSVPCGKEKQLNKNNSSSA